MGVLLGRGCLLRSFCDGKGAGFFRVWRFWRGDVSVIVAHEFRLRRNAFGLLWRQIHARLILRGGFLWRLNGNPN